MASGIGARVSCLDPPNIVNAKGIVKRFFPFAGVVHISGVKHRHALVAKVNHCVGFAVGG